MIFDFLKKLGSAAGGEGKAGPARDPVEYNGYAIVATPRKVDNGWSCEGVISKEVGGEPRSQPFIRADTLTSEQEAVDFSIGKARKIIDEQGERLFKD